ncbi:MAG: fibronectin type III domain-containing protein [Candidatus Sigynarchaeota archaeon]
MTPTVPSQPRSLNLTPSPNQISLSWQAPSFDGLSAVTGYRIYRGTEPGKLSLLASIGNVISYVNMGLTNGMEYYYAVSAINTIGEGMLCPECSAMPVGVPPAPSLGAEGGDTQVVLSWTQPITDGGSPITDYKTYRGTSSTAKTLLASTGNVMTYTDLTVSNDVTYHYQVLAVNEFGDDAYVMAPSGHT